MKVPIPDIPSYPLPMIELMTAYQVTAHPPEKGPPSPKPQQKSNNPPGRPLSDDENEDVDPSQTGGGFVENGIEFADGKVPTHHMTQLTVFWDNRIRKVKGYVPVSMFNKAWLEADRAKVNIRRLGHLL